MTVQIQTTDGTLRPMTTDEQLAFRTGIGAGTGSGSGGSSTPTSVAYSTAIPLNLTGAGSVMPKTLITTNTVFTIAAGAVTYGSCDWTIQTDGTHTVDFSALNIVNGFTPATTAGTITKFSTYKDADGIYTFGFTAGQQDVTAPLITAASVSNGTATVVNLTFNKAMNTSFVPAASTFTVSGHTVASVAFVNSTHLNLTLSAPFTYGEASRTYSYTANGTGNLQDTAGNVLANTGGSITNSVTTVPATMAAPTATVASPTSATVAFTAPANNGGATITGYTVTSTPGNFTATGTASPLTVTGLTTGVGYVFRVVATNDNGPSTASPASNSVTPATTAGFTRDYNKADSDTSTGYTGTINAGSGGPVGIKSNKAAPGTASNQVNNVFEVYEGGSANGVLSADCAGGTFTATGVIFRYVDGNNWLAAYIANTTLKLVANVAGTVTEQSLAFNQTVLPTNAIQVTFSGSSVTVKFNGTVIINGFVLPTNVMTATGAGTKHGPFWQFASTDQYTDNVIFTAS